MNLNVRRIAVLTSFIVCLAVPLGAGHCVWAGEPAKTVTVAIEFGRGKKAKQFNNVAWRKDMTVLDAMNSAKKIPPKLRFQYRGSGATALLTEIDGVRNQGGRGRNWLYRVNGQLADRSFAVFKLNENDTVLWKFQKYPERGPRE